jgi:hypothetical protein
MQIGAFKKAWIFYQLRLIICMESLVDNCLILFF